MLPSTVQVLYLKLSKARTDSVQVQFLVPASHIAASTGATAAHDLPFLDLSFDFFGLVFWAQLVMLKVVTSASMSKS